ncbi:hypothetical protein Fcan01_15716 [Folsomia candida]|uniref:Uncharacterized protein n=1 Tax=Folsomia candida TaxID=158441 RepID=A0A226DXI4_FOLCA|nr:hypothetical protein Fcan01_15716 [Folsomia candida]
MTSLTSFLLFLAISVPFLVAEDFKPVTITNKFSRMPLSSREWPSLVVGENDNSTDFAWLIIGDMIRAYDKPLCVISKEDVNVTLDSCEVINLELNKPYCRVTEIRPGGIFIIFTEGEQCLVDEGNVVGKYKRCRATAQERWTIEPYMGPRLE